MWVYVENLGEYDESVLRGIVGMHQVEKIQNLVRRPTEDKGGDYGKDDARELPVCPITSSGFCVMVALRPIEIYVNFW